MYRISQLNDLDERVLCAVPFTDYYQALRYARTIPVDRRPQILSTMAVTEYIHGPAAGVLVEIYAPEPTAVN